MPPKPNIGQFNFEEFDWEEAMNNNFQKNSIEASKKLVSYHPLKSLKESKEQNKEEANAWEGNRFQGGNVARIDSSFFDEFDQKNNFCQRNDLNFDPKNQIAKGLNIFSDEKENESRNLITKPNNSKAADKIPFQQKDSQPKSNWENQEETFSQFFYGLLSNDCSKEDSKSWKMEQKCVPQPIFIDIRNQMTLNPCKVEASYEQSNKTEIKNESFSKQSIAPSEFYPEINKNNNQEGHNENSIKAFENAKTAEVQFNGMEAEKTTNLNPVMIEEEKEHLEAPNTGHFKEQDATLMRRPKMTWADIAKHKTTIDIGNKGKPPGAKMRFDQMRTWNYFCDKELREYQFYLVETCLFFNTLVGLPTGLGKTFIALNVMNNFYRWFENGKIFFLAPTKPLVSQQLKACMDHETFNPLDLMELTGETQANERKLAYQRGRIFFMTPQTLENDIEMERLDLERIVLVIYGYKETDEAHRATKGYSYCEIQKALDKSCSGVRVIALTATPGNDMEQVLEVVQNVRASKVVLKDENDSDVAEYLHMKQIEPLEVFPNEQIINIEKKVNDILVRICSILVRCLHPEEGRLVPRTAAQIRFEPLKKAQDVFKEKRDLYMKMSGPDLVGRCHECFSSAVSFLHVRKALVDQGYSAFVKRLSNFTSKLEKKSGAINQLKKEMTKRWSEMKFLEYVVTNMKNPVHPKMEKLAEIVHNFFAEKALPNSKVIIFTQTRASAQEIEGFLKYKSKKIIPKIFVGQGDRNEIRGMDQKAQISLIKEFKRGFVNTLVATCVAEEGLDIGEVDLIVCYDSGLSPIRLVQRMGRTGRKRNGRVVLLLSEKEHAAYIFSENSRKVINEQVKSLFQSQEGEKYYFKGNPRMVPDELTPQVEIVKPSKSWSAKKVEKIEENSKFVLPYSSFGIPVKKEPEPNNYTGFDYGSESEEDDGLGWINWEQEAALEKERKAQKNDKKLKSIQILEEIQCKMEDGFPESHKMPKVLDDFWTNNQVKWEENESNGLNLRGGYLETMEGGSKKRINLASKSKENVIQFEKNS